MNIRKPYLIFLGDVETASHAKTGFGVMDWAAEDCLAQLRLAKCSVDLGLPEMEITAAVKAGAQSLLVGIAPVGGRIPEAWHATLVNAAEAGLDIVSGLHTRLEEVPFLAAAARRGGTVLVNVRIPPSGLPVGTGVKRSGRRLLTVGTDCALGKKYTALAITKTLRERGMEVDFRATGQTGILIAGAGIPLDAVISDFAAGAAELLSPAAAPDHWDIIEGQGSLFHPGYAGVTLSLVHGSQPDAIVLCHDPARSHVADAPHIAIPPLSVVVQRYLEAARLTNPEVRLVGVSLNTSSLSNTDCRRLMDDTAASLGVPCFDPVRTGAGVVATLLEKYRGDVSVH